ncbi:acyltransferase [Roseomonas populi]|uniref:Acyltransferase n=1 Tax=Roseomonas populi TaxID=3121582 RepID=A0ABT1X6G9_9PROT|nr:acyltransferase [Roseomonas pecuniae]MCR0983680.1 acyltransferase [Roseomonas pecuniae]
MTDQVLEAFDRFLADRPGVRQRLGQPGWALPDPREFQVKPLGNGNALLWRGRSNVLDIVLPGGARDNIILCDAIELGRASLTLNGGGNLVVLCASTKFQAKITIQGDGHLLYWGEGATCNEGTVVMGAGHRGTTVMFGADCMLSQRVTVRAADSHGILDVGTREVTNVPGSIVVGPHVWLGNGSTVLKDVEIGPGSIVGAGAIVTADIPALSTCVGVPARVVRQNTTWTRKSSPTEEQKDQVFRLLAQVGAAVPAPVG